LEVSYEALRRVQLEEKRSPGLTPLGEDFYERYAAHLRDQQGRLHQDFNLDAASAYESMRRVLRDVWERRQHKIAVKALLDARAREPRAEGLAREEQRLYNALHTLYSQGDASFLNGMGPAAEPEPAPAEAKGPDRARVRLLADLPAFEGPDGASHGPFRADEEIDLPPAVAALLEKRGAARAAQSALAPNPRA
jgi:DNA replication initiation complex subunit (GINS family)